MMHTGWCPRCKAEVGVVRTRPWEANVCRRCGSNAAREDEAGRNAEPD